MTDVLSDAFLDRMRLTTDPLADTAVAGVLNRGTAYEWTIDKLLDQLVSNSSPLPPGLPQEIQDYFHTTAQLPNWVDMGKVQTGEQFFEACGAECVLVLFCKSLPECYAAHRGAEVLFSTGRLMGKGKNLKPLTRRIMETAQFLLNVMAPGGLGPQGAGLVTTQKIRLIHASIRTFLKQQNWDVANYGEPINQEDMAGTLLAFSLETLEGLKILKIDVSEAQELAYLHAWNAVGAILGIDERLLMPDLASARALWARIRERQFGTSEAGRELTASLLAFLEQIVLGNTLKEMPILLMHQLMDPQMIQWLGVPDKHSWLDEVLTKALEVIFRIETSLEIEDPRFRKVVSLFSEKLLQGLVISWNGEKQVAFEIPPSLRGNWPDLSPGS
ncbi:MAG: DUF2236 domain-containing protein [Acidobacteria bacterium]|nr:DUF2236 domain-containing protein [Acidobacteriota bacterium]